MVVLTMDTYLRQMPHRAFSKLSCLLDPGGIWEKLATNIPQNLADIDNENPEQRYTMQDVQVFALMGTRQGVANSPTQKILMDWGTKNARIKHLIRVLLRAELSMAAEYLHKELLQLGPLPRPPVTAPRDSSPPPPAPAKSSPSNDPEKKVQSTPNDSDETCYPGDCAACKDCEQGFGDPAINSDDFVSRSFHDSHYSNHTPSVQVEGGAGAFNEIKQDPDDCDNWIGLDEIKIQTISYKILESLTNNFNDNALTKDVEGKPTGGNLVGSGGFGRVYMGKFNNGFMVAVKRLVQSEQIKREDLNKQFENEVKTLSTYRHENVVHLLGYSIDGPMWCLVYQYLPNGSLEDRLARLQGTPPLSANLRLKIVKGTARGICFLNSNKHVHRDIKSANILLDSEFTPKVGDFATVMAAPSGDTTTVFGVSVVIGTTAYLAPEAFQFDVSTKLDSYSFGVVLLEVITGLPAVDKKRTEQNITSHVLENVDEPSDILELADESAGEWPEGSVEKLYCIADRCIEPSKKRRPNVCDVMSDLESL